MDINIDEAKSRIRMLNNIKTLENNINSRMSEVFYILTSVELV